MGFSPGKTSPRGIALQGRPSVGHYFGVKGTEPSYITTYPYVVVNAIRPPFQVDFLGCAVPRAEAPGLFSVRPSGAWNSHQKMKAERGASVPPGRTPAPQSESR